MNKQLPDIGIYLAEQALKEYYRPRRQIIQLEEIEEFCRQEASLNLYRTYLRLQRQHIDRIVVGMVLANLAEDEQKFVQYHYRDNMGYYLITHKIPYSSTALGRINKRILTDIRTLLFYSLSADDIFHRAKVINMIHILDWRIMALSRKDLVVKTAWLQDLLEKRQRYRKLLDIMQDCLDIRNGLTRFYTDKLRPARVDNSSIMRPYYVRVNGMDRWLQTRIDKMLDCGIITTPVAVSEIHAWARERKLTETGGFLASLR